MKNAMKVLVALLAATLVLSACRKQDTMIEEDTGTGGPDAADVGESVDDAGSTEDVRETSDAETSNSIQIPGLSEPVEARLDESGVLYLSCQTDRDCFAAQGYFHAKHRFFMMDLIRRQTRGQLATVIGQLGLESDKTYRHLMTGRDGTPLEEMYYQAMSEGSREILRAYADGVNAFLEDVRLQRNDATLTAEYDFQLVDRDNIRAWEPQDTIALYLQLAYQLSDTSDDDLFRGEMAAALGADVAADLFAVRPGIESNTIQASGADPLNLVRSQPGRPDAEMLRRVSERLRPARDVLRAARARLDGSPSLLFGPKTGADGSNNWVLAPERTRDGKALLADDPHLSLSNPAIWHFVVLDSKTNGSGSLHVAGASIPSVPGVIVGHNGEVAWGVTTARLDLADTYIETLNEDGTAVIFEGQEVEILRKEFTFEVSRGSAETVEFEWVPHHGPLIAKDVEARRGVSMRWVAQEGGADVDFLEDLMRVGSVADAMSAVEKVNTVNQNWIFADREGNIGWYPHGALPNRPWASAELPNWLPLPGDGSAEWEGWVPTEDLPRMVNPPRGFIATANNDMDGSYTDSDATNDGHVPWQSPPALGHRHRRIVDLIEAGGNDHTVESMLEIQADTYSLHGEVLVEQVLTALEEAPELSGAANQVAEALETWQYTCPTGLDGSDPEAAAKVTDASVAAESIGCSAFHVMIPYLTGAVFGDELASLEDYSAVAHHFTLQAALLDVFAAPENLSRGEAYFDDVSTADVTETRGDVVAAALETTAAKLEALFGSGEPDDWRWGRIHTVTFSSLFSAAGITTFDNGPYANDGGFFTVDVANPGGRAGSFDDNFNHPNGASMRVVFEVGESDIRGWYQLPGGQDHHRDSRFYGSLVDDWLTNTPRELLYTHDAIEQAAVETFELRP